MKFNWKIAILAAVITGVMVAVAYSQPVVDRYVGSEGPIYIHVPDDRDPEAG